MSEQVCGTLLLERNLRCELPAGHGNHHRARHDPAKYPGTATAWTTLTPSEAWELISERAQRDMKWLELVSSVIQINIRVSVAEDQSS